MRSARKILAEDLAATRLAVVGAGYVGRPLIEAFCRHFPVLGYDIDKARIAALKEEFDLDAPGAPQLTSDPEALRGFNTYIVTVPTPIEKWNVPDLGPVKEAMKTVGRAMAKGALVILESTVWPGVTQGICAPLLAEASGLECNRDFYLGYSPERIDPGNRERGLKDIVKLTSGSTPEIAQRVDRLYRLVVDAGTYAAPSIEVAEASKLVENVQRDLNIAFVNECAVMFKSMGISSREVLAAANTKWNFLPFTPGFVGGHCISVDPWYLYHRANDAGYRSQLIFAARNRNDGMPVVVAADLMRLMADANLAVAGSRALILGIAFKADSGDVRNSGSEPLARELKRLGMEVDIYDPLADAAEVRREFALEICPEPQRGAYEVVVLAVAHRAFLELGSDGLRAWGKPRHLLYDVRHALPQGAADGEV